MYTPSTTPKGKFEVLLPPPERQWRLATIQDVANALRDYSMNPADDYDKMIRLNLRGDIHGTIRLGDSWYRFSPY